MQEPKQDERAVSSSKSETVNMSEKRISLGINISILVILTIFGVLLSLPLKLLLTTNYYNRNETIDKNSTVEVTRDLSSEVAKVPVPTDHRKLRRCPRFGYEDRLKSVYRSDYDGNCTYTNEQPSTDPGVKDGEDKSLAVSEGKNETSETLKEVLAENGAEKAEESGKECRTKSVPVAGHILVTMLVISAIAAFVEVLRIRFARDKAGSITSRKTSMVELPIQRRFLPRYPIKSQRSFEMNRSALRLLGARPPPLIRRSSFPTQPSKQSPGSVSGTPNNRISRRQSAESDEEIGVLISALRHRTRLLRRH
ncbi:PREDICTED: uncharacterized protein LOC108545219 isoform X2 [Eufriesea mexicana]|uniref:uncharacterized protein LOC108545219 isoform X2 n=1 Tax=Eufriesea mexicana TaxID=516756 RepID=UPI00083BB9C4|nr:PREDICTED: uncharacterized protein LOC108545219 isoform X2 [Eufriesea mexicana]